MPAPRTCRSCGAALDTRRCPGCGAEASEFAARPPLQADGFVGQPSHLQVQRGHYSRWESSPTTFGPAARIGASALLFGFLVVGFFVDFFILWFVQLFLTGWLLKEIWRRGWVVPTGEPSAHDDVPRIEVITSGIRVPPPRERREPVTDRPRSAGEKAGFTLLVIAGGALVVVFTVGTDEMRVATIMLATLIGLYAFFSSFLR